MQCIYLSLEYVSHVVGCCRFRIVRTNNPNVWTNMFGRTCFVGGLDVILQRSGGEGNRHKNVKPVPNYD